MQENININVYPVPTKMILFFKKVNLLGMKVPR